MLFGHNHLLILGVTLGRKIITQVMGIFQLSLWGQSDFKWLRVRDAFLREIGTWVGKALSQDVLYNL